MGTPFSPCKGLAHALLPIPTAKEPANAEPEELFTGYGDDDWTARVQSSELGPFVRRLEPWFCPDV